MRIIKTVVTLAALLGLVSTAAADEAAPERQAQAEAPFMNGFFDDDEVLGGSFSTWIEFASDYVFRGESETNDGKIPSLKGSITWTHNSGAYLGIYLANNLFPGNDRAGNDADINAVLGPYAGYATSDIMGTGINYNGFLFQYTYPADSDSNYLEFFNYIDKQFGPVNVKLEYTPTLTDWFGVEDLQSHNVAIHPSISLPKDFVLSGTLGYQMFDNNGPNLDADGDGREELDWVHWNVGVSRNIFGFKMDLRYHDTDIEIGGHDLYGFPDNNQIVDERFVVSVSKTF